MTVMLMTANPADPMAHRPIRCQIEVHPSGSVTVLRSPGCTEADLIDLFAAMGSGHVSVIDVTPETGHEARNPLR